MIRIANVILYLISVMLCFSCNSTNGASIYSREEISEVVSSGDYDDMIEALNAGLEECATVKDNYFAGDVTDNQAKAKIEEIMSRYKPLSERLQKADLKGELTYNQHKALFELLSKAVSYTADGLNKVLNDMGLSNNNQEDEPYNE